MLGGTDAAAFAKLLRSEEGVRRASSAIQSCTGNLRAAVLRDVERLEAVWKLADESAAFELAHEIRGMAETVGLTTTGRVAAGLCKYLDTAKIRGRSADAAVIALHVDAIARAASAEDEATEYGGHVVAGLSTLVEKKLDSVNDLERTAAPFTC